MNYPKPKVTSVTPQFPYVNDTIIVEGMNFTQDASVWFKQNPTGQGTRAQQCTWKNANKVEATVPTLVSGEYYVSIKTSAGESNIDKKVTVSNPAEQLPGLEMAMEAE
ncbi:IPT/TIG domain-containing protein [Streptomyces sp. UG1]|uniref:IPT/TIG domain-containing protein n=1 Tax=Streptomyces sp. UG1 TaxID=3417652 RepID=UPI003CEF006B